MSDYLRLPRGLFDRDEEWLTKHRFIVDAFAKRARQLDFEAVYTSSLALSATFQRAAHITGEKIYEFKDRKGRNLMLAPDSTPGVLRWYLHSRTGSDPSRVFFYSPVFRYRQSGSWKTRNPHQLGFALINEPQADSYDTDEGSLLLIRTAMRVLVRDLGLSVSLRLTNFSILDHSLRLMGIVDSDRNNVLHTLRPLDQEARNMWIRSNLPMIEERENFAILLSLQLPINNNEFAAPPKECPKELFSRIQPSLDFAARCVDGFEVKSLLDLSDLHSSETHDGIGFQFFTPDNQQMGDGGSYTAYGMRFDSRIQSLKSFGTSVESLMLYQTKVPTNSTNRKVLLAAIDCSPIFAMQVAEDLIEMGQTVIQRRIVGKLSKLLQGYSESYRWLIVLGKQEELSKKTQVRDLQTRHVYEVDLEGLGTWLASVDS